MRISEDIGTVFESSAVATWSYDSHLVTLQHQTCEPSSRKGASVDVNTIGANIGPFPWCVTVDDDLAEILFVQQKIVSDPKQILLALLNERNARSNARVSEKIMAA